MYYVIQHKYVGPNQTQDKYVDASTVVISTSPARGNQSHDIRLDGWCGTTNDWAVYAHGEYATIEAAQAALREKFGAVRDQDPNGDAFDNDDPDVVETYKPGQHEPMSASATGDWVFPGLQADINADTTDERIAQLVAEYEGAANAEGYSLDSRLEDTMQRRRQELRDEEAYQKEMKNDA